MSYCGSTKWISDYYFSKALRYRLSRTTPMITAYDPAARGLLVWGGVNRDGDLVLEPDFAVNAPGTLPQLDGPYLVRGEGPDGRTLFSLPFGMPEIGDGEGGSFAFILPVRPDWHDRLVRITLSGPEGFASIGKGDDSATTTSGLLLDSVTGQVRGFLRDWPSPDESLRAARRSLPVPDVEVIISTGIPDPADWNQ